MNTLPPNWAVLPLQDIASYSTGRTPPRANAKYWQGEPVAPWVTIADMQPYGIIETTRESITDLALRDVFRGRMVEPGTLLMSFKLTIGRIATLGVSACHNEAIIALYPRPQVDQAYLAYYLSQVDYTSLQDRQIKGQTLNQSKIDKIPVALPPIDEQKCIARVLDLIRAGVKAASLAAQRTADLKRAAMHELFTKGLRGEPQKETEIGLVPESWDVVPVHQHFELSSGGTPSRNNAAFWVGGKIPWVKTAEVDYREITSTSEHITEAGLKNSAAKLLPVGTILLAMYGQGVTRGKAAILGIEAASNQACAAMRPLDGAITGRFLYHQMAYRYSEIRSLAHGGQQQNLNLDLVRRFKIARPGDVEDQLSVCEIIDALDKKVELQAKKQVLMESLFQSLLHALMTGEVRVSDLDLSALDGLGMSGGRP